MGSSDYTCFILGYMQLHKIYPHIKISNNEFYNELLTNIIKKFPTTDVIIDADFDNSDEEVEYNESYKIKYNEDSDPEVLNPEYAVLCKLKNKLENVLNTKDVELDEVGIYKINSDFQQVENSEEGLTYDSENIVFNDYYFCLHPQAYKYILKGENGCSPELLHDICNNGFIPHSIRSDWIQLTYKECLYEIRKYFEPLKIKLDSFKFKGYGLKDVRFYEEGSYKVVCK